MDAGWRFYLGDVASALPNTHIAAYMNHKAGWARGAARRNFDDTDWRVLDVPHDWSVELPRDPNEHVDASFLPRGVAWYRRHFRLDESDAGRYVALRFDGVATHCTVYVNGHLVHRHFSGYTPFTIDISDVVTTGDDQPNVVALRVDATYMEGWWYEGAGIYRHVWLIKKNRVHVADDGVFVRTECNANGWDTLIETKVRNVSDAAAECRVTSRLGDAMQESSVLVPPRSSATVHHAIPARPKPWSIKS